jgi:serine/threonine-protein kinase
VRTFGKYRLLEPIASGGMADVWRAEVTGAEGVVKEVALKLVRGEHASRGDFVRMFVQEARLAARLGHGNVVQVFEFDQIDGRYYIAMELVRGRHLGCVVDRARELGIRFGVARALQVGSDVARALGYAHRLSENGRPLGLVHRDVSPHNVLVSFEGEVKLADFGIARAMDRAGFTDPGTMKGKVAYMAPEQARGAPVDARADVFSLGVVLWELCAGRRLFARDSEAATLAVLLSNEPISPPSSWNEEVPQELDRALLGALERDAERRTGSAQELATALGGVLFRVARSPEDLDLRAFMHRLFAPEVAALQEPPAEPTRVRPVAMAAEPEAELSPWGDDPGRAGEAEAETRTAVVPRRRARSWAAAGVAGAALAAVVAATSSSSSPTAIPTSAHPERSADAGGAESKGTPTSAHPERSAEAGGAESKGTPPARADVDPEALPALGAAPLETARELNALRVPHRASGQGILSVNAIPWGLVRVNGHAVGETPQELRLPAGRHRVRIERKGHRAIDELVTVKPGARTKLLR